MVRELSPAIASSLEMIKSLPIVKTVFPSLRGGKKVMTEKAEDFPHSTPTKVEATPFLENRMMVLPLSLFILDTP